MSLSDGLEGEGQVIEPPMANLVITYWRDIPSAVSVKAGRKEEKRMLADRFQEAIDMAAMRGGASDTDSYLADEVEKAKAEIEATFTPDKLKTLIANGGKAQ